MRWLLPVCLFTSPALAATLHPEDGSAITRKWYSSPQGFAAGHRAVTEFLSRQGVQVVDPRIAYNWAQDIFIFGADGALSIMAPMPHDDEILVGLTTGVFGDPKEGQPLLTAHPSWAARIGVATQRFEHSFVEGGELIAGRHADGRPYALVPQDVLERTKRFRKLASIEAARPLVARDFGVAPKDLVALEGGAHLDLWILALPNGELLVDDPRLVKDFVERILREDTGLLSKERTGLRGILDYHKQLDRQMGSELARLDRNLKILEASSLRVHRTPGTFARFASPGFIERDLNFLNGWIGRSPQHGGLFAVLNGHADFPRLREHFRNLLGNHGIAPEHVFNEGLYTSGAGIDCRGAQSP